MSKEIPSSTTIGQENAADLNLEHTYSEALIRMESAGVTPAYELFRLLAQTISLTVEATNLT